MTNAITTQQPNALIAAAERQTVIGALADAASAAAALDRTPRQYRTPPARRHGTIWGKGSEACMIPLAQLRKEDRVT